MPRPLAPYQCYATDPFRTFAQCAGGWTSYRLPHRSSVVDSMRLS
jgi:hypothetical protein